MAKIIEIKAFEVKLVIECDCGKKYKWLEGGNTKCPECGTEHELVLMPKSIRPENDITEKNCSCLHSALQG